MLLHPIKMKINLIQLLILLFSSSVLAAELPKHSAYRESIDIHLGRTTYVSGEMLFYKAYFSAMQKEKVEVLSKVAYIELVNDKGQAILKQVLEINNSCASSVMLIPDTLNTGLYTLTGYTQWMRNFSKEHFFSEPVFIYNQYDENAPFALANYMVPMSPELYIEGGKLTADATSRIVIKIPGLFGKQIPCSIGESDSDTLRQSFTTDQDGIAVIAFKPVYNTRYKLTFGDSFSGKTSCDLPLAEYSGYFIHPLSFDSNSLQLTLEKHNVPDEAVRLLAVIDGKIIAEQNLPKGKGDNVISLLLPEVSFPMVHLQLVRSTGEILSEQVVIIETQSNLSVKLPKTEYSTHEKIDINFGVNNFSEQKFKSFSLSVYKNQSSESQLIRPSEALVRGDYAYLKVQNVFSVIPRNTIDERKSVQNSLTGCFDQFPIEDLGILITGKVYNNQTNTPAKGIEVNLAVKDTLATILAARTDSMGCFGMLLNSNGTKFGNIILKRDGEILDRNYEVMIDDKSDFIRLDSKQPMALSTDQQFIATMKDEAQRALIQRAFHSNGTSQTKHILTHPTSQEPFYGKPQITVYPGNFIALPNFEEIAREVLPRVRYRQTKSGCEAYVTDIENNVKSERPVLLLDGVPVVATCDLYPLNSDDIKRVEIQSGNRVSGNLLYNGLIAVYTNDNYKTKKKDIDERVAFQIPGYVNNESVYSVPEESGKTSAKSPDFRNQLYWNPDIEIKGDQPSGISFYTSDEEGEYVIDILGYTAEGYPVQIRQTFTVSDQ
jgi:hypothetical protein